MAYEETVLERPNLERYARRVARELGGTAPTTRIVDTIALVPVTTTKWFGLRTSTTHESRTVRRDEAVPGSRWLLGRRVINNKTQHGRSDYNEQHDVESFYLEWGGELTYDWESWEDGISGGRYWQGGKEAGDKRPMSTSASCCSITTSSTRPGESASMPRAWACQRSSKGSSTSGGLRT